MMFRTPIIGMMMFLAISCDGESLPIETNLKSIGLVGTWQLSETYISPGGITEWVTVEDGFHYIFEANGSFKKIENNGTVKEEGNYRQDESELFLEFDFEGTLTTMGYYFERTDDSITLSPSFPSICIEACLYRFKRK